MSNVSVGRALEHEVRKLFEAAGWSLVRGASSKGKFDSVDGVVKPDLIASKVTSRKKREVQIILMQCKVGKG